MRNTIEDKDKLADKLDASEKAEINDALTETEDWLNTNQEAEKDEFEDKMRELQSVCDPIIARIYEN